MLKRVAIVVLAAWVLFSGNAWAHNRANLINNAFVGWGLLFFGTLSMRHDWARFVTLGFGVWLFAFTALFSRSDPVTFWNDAAVAIVVFVLSMVGGKDRVELRPAGTPIAPERVRQHLHWPPWDTGVRAR